MEKPACVVIFITAPGKAEAERMARRLLEQRKAACVNIISGVDSLFWWQGKLDSARESLMVVKTEAALVSEVVRIVREEHSDTVPEVIALPVIGGNSDYLEWISKEVR